MVTVPSQLIGVVLLIGAAFIGREAWSYIKQYRMMAAIDPSETPVIEPGNTVTLQGAARVTEPISLAELPDESVESEDDIGLYAWRVRRKRQKSGSDGSSWTTTDAGFEIGSFGVETTDGTVQVDEQAVTELVPSGLGTNDPWESTELHLGDPDTEISLSNTESLLHGPEFDIKPLDGNGSARFQANTITDGDQILVHGEIERTDDLSVTRGKTTPLVIGSGSMTDLTGELRKKIAYNLFLVLILIVFAAAGFGGLLEIGASGG